MMLNILVCLPATCMSYFVKCIFKSFALLKLGLFDFLLLSLENFKIYFGYTLFVRHVIHKYFSITL